ncbi:sugar ABC transporter substrate-binding protein [Psychrosphaera aestuarii]|uniref:sugar ABC transporter substrate-binding protein n=1 Tax=Psychrosphaera aestuarii TaxID=1266052 RepID=UPI001B33D3AE|nr:extracellular solute-binding protein [Psychrosphaera aestuarii]
MAFLYVFALQSNYVYAQASNQITLAYGLENYNLQPLFDEFSAQTGISINVAAFKNNELKAELIERATNKQLPDAIIVPSDFAGLDSIRVSPIPNTLFSKSTNQTAIKSTIVAGKSLGIPIVYGNHLVLYFNKKLVKTPAKSWREILQQGSELSNEFDLIAWNYLEMYWFIPFLGTYGDFPYINGKLTLDSDGMVAALKWYKNLNTNGLVDLDCDYECAKNKFLSGKLAYTINGSWALGEYKQILNDDLGIALLPRLGDLAMKPYFSSHVLAFPDKSLQGNKAESLKKLALFFQSDKAQAMIWGMLNSIPTNNNTLSYIQSQGNQDLNILLEQLELSEPMPNDHNMAIVWEAMLKGTNRFLADVFDAKSAAKYMQHIASKSIEHANDKN